MCLIGATCLPTDPVKRVGLVQNVHNHHLIECSRHDIAESLLTWLLTSIIHSLIFLCNSIHLPFLKHKT
jgi:hypothetical protein